MTEPIVLHWTNPSVVKFAANRDPVEAVQEAAREVVLRAREKGWQGPPFNPVELAPLFGAKLRPNSSVLDARVYIDNGETVIEYNPQQSRERIRFSIAHELAHILFPDYHVETRNRSHETKGNDWQLEMLCNIAASEFVLPIGSLPADLGDKSLSELMIDRREFDVSAEAFLIRIVKISEKPITMFVASPDLGVEGERRYFVEYSLCSPTANEYRLRGANIPNESAVQQCTAIGYTQSEIANWATGTDELIEYVGIPSFPGCRFPRVAGLIRHDAAQTGRRPIKYLHGDVLDIQAPGSKIICQLVNDKSISWGGGVAKRVAQKFPEAQSQFAENIMRMSRQHRLGSVIFSKLEDDLCLASIIGQEGYGPSLFPRVRYSAIETGLKQVAKFAKARHASVHLPRIGTGAAGGEWGIIEEMIDNELVRTGVDVTVYDLPPKRKQLELF